MASFEIVGVFLDAPSRFVAGITDIELVRSGGDLHLYTVTRAGGGMLAFNVAVGAGLGLDLIDQQALIETETLSVRGRIDQVTLNGQSHMLVTGSGEPSLGGYSLGAAGRFGSALALANDGAVATQAVVELAGQSFLYAHRISTATLAAYQIDQEGQAVWISDTVLPVDFQGLDVTAMVPVTLSGGQFLFVLSAASDALRSYRILADGSLQEVSVLGAGGGLGIAAPSAMVIVDFGGQKYALVTAAGSSSISVVALESQGRMNLTDHVIDTLDTRFQGTGAIASVTIEGRVYVIAGGGDNGLSLFTLLPNGRLLHLGNQLEQQGFPLDNITALEATVVDGKIEVFVVGEGAGLLRLRINPGEVTAMREGGAAADSLVGGAGADLIFGQVGNDTIRGGGGNDILMDGAGNDNLYGGAGADIFVISADDGWNRIFDFEPGVDRIDLTSWGRVYSTAALTIKRYATGYITIGFGSESVTIYAASGQSIFASDFQASDLFGLWHVVAEPVYEGLRLQGSADADTMTGNAGADTLVGSLGPDTLDGRGGFDLADYAAAGARLEVDLDAPVRNTGLALGDVHIGIEGVAGGAGDDLLWGSAEANLLRGDEGADLLSGRGGEDTLNGGAGDDTLCGGVGGDRLAGGAGRDLASHADAQGGVRADLAAPNLNKGDAAGDTYDGIEDVSGTDFADTLGGDVGGNRLWGLAGGDVLMGRAGADAIFGGDGDDTLDGGGGDDTLLGGLGTDEIIFETAANLHVDLTIIGAQATGQGLDWIEGVEWITSGDGDDWLMGNDADNRLIGNDGRDSLFGGLGADSLQGDAGDDVLDGGEGEDWLVFAGRIDVWVNLSVTVAQATGQGMDLLSGFEHVKSGAGDDRITGSGGASHLIGGGGADTLTGGNGGDTLEGGEGADMLRGDAGDDRLSGGAGRDLAIFAGSVRTTVNLGRDGAQDTGHGLDYLSGIENVTSGSAADVLIGDGADNVLDGQGGRDHLIGGTGNDSLLGGAGADTLRGDAGHDVLAGGAGQDWLEFSGRRGVSVDLGIRGLQDSGQGRDLITDIEHLRGTGGRDRLGGDAGANILSGGGGDDWLSGGAGRDRLEGGRGEDVLIGGAGGDTFVFDGGRDRIKDLHARQGDRILLDQDALPGLQGMSAWQVVKTYGHVTKNGLVLDLPGPHRLVIDDLESMRQLAEHLFMI